MSGACQFNGIHSYIARSHSFGVPLPAHHTHHNITCTWGQMPSLASMPCLWGTAGLGRGCARWLAACRSEWACPAKWGLVLHVVLLYLGPAQFCDQGSKGSKLVALHHPAGATHSGVVLPSPQTPRPAVGVSVGGSAETQGCDVHQPLPSTSAPLAVSLFLVSPL